MTKKPKIKNCKTCQGEFVPYTSLDKFCGFLCRVQNQKASRKYNWSPEKVEKRKGINNPAYKNGGRCLGVKQDNAGDKLYRKNRDAYKEEIINEKGYICCEKCGRNDGRIETHHIVYRSEKPNHEHLHSKENLIFVCVLCHNWFHKAKGNRNELVQERKLNLLFGNDILDK
jgi:hypothetical protein